MLRTLLTAMALTLMAYAYACGTYAADETTPIFTTRGDGMQCVTIGDRTYCDSGCGR